MGGIDSGDITLFKVLKKVSVGTIDEISDWVVLVGFAVAGDVYWFKTSLAIQSVNTFISGIMLATWATGVWGQNSPNLSLGAKAPLLVLCGGFAPAAVGAIALLREDPNITYEDLKYFQAVALFLETLPQTTLQAYVGISYGEFPDGRYSLNDTHLGFSNYLLLASLVIGFWSAGQAYADIFRLVADNHIDHGWSAYKVVSYAYRAVQAATFVLWSAFMYCKYKSGGFIAFGFSYIFYIMMGIIEESRFDLSLKGGEATCGGMCRNCLSLSCFLCGLTFHPDQRERLGCLEFNVRTLFAWLFFAFYMFAIQASFYWGSPTGVTNDYGSRDTSLGQCELLDFSMCSTIIQSSCTETTCDAAGYRYRKRGEGICYEINANSDCLNDHSYAFSCAQSAITCAAMDLSDTLVQQCNARLVNGQNQVDAATGACVADPAYHHGGCVHPDSGKMDKATCEDAGFGWVQQQYFRCEDRGWTTVAWWTFGMFYLLGIMKWMLDPDDRRELICCV